MLSLLLAPCAPSIHLPHCLTTDHPLCDASVLSCCPQTQNRVRNVFMVFVFFFLLVGVINLMAGFDYAKKKLLW